MNADQGLFVPLLLGIVEGLPKSTVSSTGHLLLVEHFMGLNGDEWKAFTVLIQLGAILAIVTVYFAKLIAIARDAIAGKKEAWGFIRNVVLACLPAVVAGVLLHDFIKGVLYESPVAVCVALIVGGVILLFVDQLKLKPRYTDTYSFPALTCLYIGLFQMLALVPGVSRSGATIVGSLLLGTDKRSAAEFSFFIALPVMTGAFGYDLYKNRDIITMDGALSIAVGFAAAFVVGALVVKYLLDFVSRHGFAPFAYWRIFVGAIGLWGVLLFG